MSTYPVIPYLSKYFNLVKRAVLLLFFSTVLTTNIAAQTSKDYQNAQRVVNSVFHNDLPNSYMLFSIENSEYLIVEKKGESFKEHFVEVNEQNIITNVIQKSIQKNTTLNRAFNKELYFKDYVDLESPYFIARNSFSQGKPIYFYYKDKDGNMYGESKLTTIIHPNPIDLSVFGYLLNELTATFNKKA
ncbi:conserved exported hypothetical protein [Tenacibaculum sp. 190524A05c]|uniref:hypothetical protein n=1 Tax=Tenacibaculum platacis TaxID=3137852 RepID=UPI0031FA8FFA